MAIEILKIYVFPQFFPSFYLLIVLFIFDFFGRFLTRDCFKTIRKTAIFCSLAVFPELFGRCVFITKYENRKFLFFFATLLLSCNQTTWNRGSVGTDRHSGL